jgi:hypothetical protein
MHAQRGRPEWDSVYARNEAMKDICIREVLQEDRCSSMYSNYYAFVVLYLHVFTYYAAIPASRESDS